MYKDISEEWKEECEKIKRMSEPLSLMGFGLERMDRSLSTEFKVLSYMTQTQQHLQKLDKNPDHFPFNRISAIMPFDKNRVILGQPDKKDHSENYINANIINIFNKKLIATQGPLYTTFFNFWRMVEEYKVSTIFMLCDKLQKSTVKCDPYWPSNPTSPLIQGKYQISFLEEAEEKQVKIRKFLLKNTETNNQMIVNQYNVLCWPDGGRPLPNSKKIIYKMVGALVDLMKQEKMSIIHCSAGVGRTGTFIAMAELKVLVETQDNISIFECVRKLRQQRWSMVYTQTQYEYLYDYVEDLSKKRFQPNIESEEDI